jgi:hypothetical protein
MDGRPAVAPWVFCGEPAILRSPRGRPRHWACALAWTEAHHQADEHGRRGRNGPQDVSVLADGGAEQVPDAVGEGQAERSADD